MIKPLLHPEEAKRLQALKNYDILDTAPEQKYDDITQLASYICGTPIAVISLLDDKRQWFKSKKGMPLDETPRDEAFCAHAILETDIFIVPDAEKDERFHDNPLVTSEATKVRFYAGAQLTTEDGLPLGMLCVMDQKPRELTPEQKDALTSLARQVLAQLELKENLKKVEENIEQIKQMQTQLVMQEKLASLGSLTAGIAHEIKNPLNFINNFARLSSDLTTELTDELEKLKNKLGDGFEDLNDIINDLNTNVIKINEHGKRADNIVKGMLMHSRGKTGEKEEVNINSILDEYTKLAYHGLRAQNNEFNVAIKTDYDFSLKQLSVNPQNLSRVFLNIMNNACYAAFKKKTELKNGFEPEVKISTKDTGDTVEIKIRDNGTGIPDNIKDKIFNPFFTTKPTGEGTGLGLSMSYDIIVQEHKGSIAVDTAEGEFTEFTIHLPK